MQPNLSSFSTPSNSILKPGGSLKWKKGLVKDARLSLLLREVMKIAKLTSPLPGVSCLSLPRPRLMHSRRLSLLFRLNLTLNLYTLFFALLQALLPHLPPLLTSPIVPLPGNWLRSSLITRHPTFLSLSQRPCVAEPAATFPSSAEPRALRTLTRPSALPSPSMNFLGLPPTSPPLLSLAQTKLPIPC